ncbi:hypothetical protein LOK49_LG14G00390 [Camellia lanceoleosa]|uniref:Uncharacterized protein n=1 Tax=Camellia lanceoleosa TaxID=1840588 RepID=A0ACC0FCQ4_9ERIC|nr:hypothetical protein LOK49_LG14G00390 [Camellia lanceoleosa]
MDNTSAASNGRTETFRFSVAFSNFFKKERREGEGERIWGSGEVGCGTEEPTRTPVLNRNPTLRATNTEREGGRVGESSQSETLPWAQRALREKGREGGGRKWERRG